MKKDNNKKEIHTANGGVYQIPLEGSLNLLALGYVGLEAWREKKKKESYHLNQHLIIPNKKE